jgi:CubicO group peptidase (beta-lactamase class C family)
MGFSASPNDWILLGLFVIKSLKAHDCFAEYLKIATMTQIDNPDFYDHRDYGYQIWSNCDIGLGAFCFVGAFGQLLMIEPEKELVLYIHSTNGKWGEVVYWGLYLWEAYKK